MVSDDMDFVQKDSEKFREVSKRAKVTGREFYLAQKREPTRTAEHG
jgi:hypothetical protein